MKQLLADAAAQMGERAHGAQIAFFGGSFTAIERSYMTELLEVAADAVSRYGFMGIRCSTRPDAIDRETLDILKKYGVTAIELGAQSMNDDVLRLNRRGHSSADVERASRLIREYGIELGLQMMTGLPGDTDAEAMVTMRRLVSLKPDTMRIYPTIVLENTLLCDWYKSGVYRPQTLDEAVELCSGLIPEIEGAGVRLIRVGLHASEALDNRVAGPYHPAFMELCRSKIFLGELTAKLSAKNIREATVYAAPQMLSIALGQKRCNIEKLLSMGYRVEIKPDNSLTGKIYRIE